MVLSVPEITTYFFIDFCSGNSGFRTNASLKNQMALIPHRKGKNAKPKKKYFLQSPNLSASLILARDKSMFVYFLCNFHEKNLHNVSFTNSFFSSDETKTWLSYKHKSQVKFWKNAKNLRKVSCNLTTFSILTYQVASLALKQFFLSSMNNFDEKLSKIL